MSNLLKVLLAQCKDTAIFLAALEPFKKNLVVGCESTFNWYWLADLLQEHKIEFILGFSCVDVPNA